MSQNMIDEADMANNFILSCMDCTGPGICKGLEPTTLFCMEIDL